MHYTLDEFATDCRTALQNNAGEAAYDAVCVHVSRALKDEAFVAEYVPEDADEQRKIIYEDPDLGFCICAHVYNEPKQGNPHDHGPTWAIYGQAAGETDMTDWEIITPAEGDEPAKVVQTRKYRMTPGDAHVYPVGAIHAPYRDGPTRLIRIEGQNTDNLERTPIEEA